MEIVIQRGKYQNTHVFKNVSLYFAFFLSLIIFKRLKKEIIIKKVFIKVHFSLLFLMYKWNKEKMINYQSVLFLYLYLYFFLSKHK